MSLCNSHYEIPLTCVTSLSRHPHPWIQRGVTSPFMCKLEWYDSLTPYLPTVPPNYLGESPSGLSYIHICSSNSLSCSSFPSQDTHFDIFSPASWPKKLHSQSWTCFGVQSLGGLQSSHHASWNAWCTQSNQVPEQGENLVVHLHCQLNLAKQDFPFTEFSSFYKHRLVLLTRDTLCEIWRAGVKQQPYFFHSVSLYSRVATCPHLSLICYWAGASPTTFAASVNSWPGPCATLWWRDPLSPAYHLRHQGRR